jgi:hypothetical protein
MARYFDEDTRQRLITLTESAHNEAFACRSAGAYRAACVMLGSAVEAALLATVAAVEDRLRESGQWPTGNPLRWDLGTLLKIAGQADLLPVSTSGYELSDEVKAVKQLRNLVHPAAYVRDVPANFEADEALFQAAYRVLDEVYEATLAVINNPRGRA